MIRLAFRQLVHILALLLAWGAASASEPVRVVATFSILGDMVRNVGGSEIKLTTLVGPNSDAHVYQPTPANAKAVAEASIIFANGLGFEGWLDRLLESAGYRGPVIVASRGIQVHAFIDTNGPARAAMSEETVANADRSSTQEVDPHAWQSLANGQIYVTNIIKGLVTLDPANATIYQRQGAAYLEQIQRIEQQVQGLIGQIPQGHRRVVTSHDAFGYFGDAYEVEFIAPVGISTEAEPSAGEVARLIQQIRTEGITAVFVENIADKRLIEQITRETGSVIGGTLYSDALSNAHGPAATYTEMFLHNATTLALAMKMTDARKRPIDGARR